MVLPGAVPFVERVFAGGGGKVLDCAGLCAEGVFCGGEDGWHLDCELGDWFWDGRTHVVRLVCCVFVKGLTGLLGLSLIRVLWMVKSV